MDRRAILAFLTATAAAPYWVTAQAHAASVKPITIAKGLDHPWGLEFLPDGSALVSERPGRLRRVTMKGAVSAPITGLPAGIFTDGQGGLLDIALDPDFVRTRRLFFSFAEVRPGGNCTSVGRGKLSADFKSLTEVKTIFRQNTVYNGDKHFGSRLVFDRGKNLFVTTGERFDLRDKAQDPRSHLGKILHITRDGQPAPDNPHKQGWAAEIWSIGHRNVQGATLHPSTGRLWTAEHGAMGGDEINLPLAGKNYGWPVISYGKNYDGSKIGIGTAKAGMEQPLRYWDPSIAPAGMTFYTGSRYPGWKGSLFVCALRGQHVARLAFDGVKLVRQERLLSGFARFRDIRQGPDGYLYVITDVGKPEGGLYRIG